MALQNLTWNLISSFAHKFVQVLRTAHWGCFYHMLTKPFHKRNHVLQGWNFAKTLQTLMNYHWNKLTWQVYSWVKPKNEDKLVPWSANHCFSKAPCSLGHGFALSRWSHRDQRSPLLVINHRCERFIRTWKCTSDLQKINDQIKWGVKVVFPFSTWTAFIWMNLCFLEGVGWEWMHFLWGGDLFGQEIDCEKLLMQSISNQDRIFSNLMTFHGCIRNRRQLSMA